MAYTTLFAARGSGDQKFERETMSGVIQYHIRHNQCILLYMGTLCLQESVLFSGLIKIMFVVLTIGYLEESRNTCAWYIFVSSGGTLGIAFLDS